MGVDSERESYAALDPKLVGGERLEVAQTSVSALEDIIMEIHDFAETLKACASAEDDLSRCVPRLIGIHLTRLAEDAENARAKVFHALHTAKRERTLRS